MCYNDPKGLPEPGVELARGTERRRKDRKAREGCRKRVRGERGRRKLRQELRSSRNSGIRE